MSDFIIMDREGVVPSREKRIKRIKGRYEKKKGKADIKEHLLPKG